MPSHRPHPHFDDRGAFDWHQNLDNALAEARRSGKRVFIEYGREACGQCRALVQSTLQRPELAQALRAGWVMLAADCDAGEEPVELLAQQVPDGMMLPFVILADAEGRYLEGRAGDVDARWLAQVLQRHTAPPREAP